MTSTTPKSARALGTLHAADGLGVVRFKLRLDTPIEELWQALTDPRRLNSWLGEVDGDLRQGGTYRAHHFASGAAATPG